VRPPARKGLRVIFYRRYVACQTSLTNLLDMTAMENPSQLPSEVIAKLRMLAHDLSNSLETILQAAYLLGEVEAEGNRKKWAQMIDASAQDAARINREIRQILKAQSAVVGSQSSPASKKLTTED
jgi:signal transduction histidine kinase